MYPVEFFLTWKGVKPCSLQTAIKVEIISGSVILVPITSMAGVSGGQSSSFVSYILPMHHITLVRNSKWNSV